MDNKDHIKFKITIKEGVNPKEIELITEFTKELLVYAALFCYQNNVPCTITSILEDVDGRETSSHKEGRALDLSVRYWSQETIDKLVREGNKDKEHIAAFSRSDGKPRAFVFHKLENGKPHLHIQSRRK